MKLASRVALTSVLVFSIAGIGATTAGATSTATPQHHRRHRPPAIIFNGEGNDLNAYSSVPPFTRQVVDHHNDASHPNGLDINGQICFDPHNPRRFVAGEDTHQTTTGHPGWGIFNLRGDRIGNLSIREVGKLVPTYQPSSDNPENYGCGFLPGGRIVTTDVGNQASGGGDGQLIVWFRPFDSFNVRYCKIDVTLATGQGVMITRNFVYVAQARRGILRYPIANFPTSNTPAGGCDSKDATGAPMTTKVKPTMFIAPDPVNDVATPNAIVKAPNGHLYVSSVINGVIAEYTAGGTFIRKVVQPAPGEVLGTKPYSVGTPLGLGVDPKGNLFYADIGIIITSTSVGPGPRTGTVRRVSFVQGNPQAPVVMDEGLAFPDGIGVWLPPPR